MQSDRFLKLIVVADINNLKLFSARGLKILELLKDMTLESEVDIKKKNMIAYIKKNPPLARVLSLTLRLKACNIKNPLVRYLHILTM